MDLPERLEMGFGGLFVGGIIGGVLGLLTGSWTVFFIFVVLACVLGLFFDELFTGALIGAVAGVVIGGIVALIIDSWKTSWWVFTIIAIICIVLGLGFSAFVAMGERDDNKKKVKEEEAKKLVEQKHKAINIVFNKYYKPNWGKRNFSHIMNDLGKTEYEYALLNEEKEYIDRCFNNLVNNYLKTSAQSFVDLQCRPHEICSWLKDLTTLPNIGESFKPLLVNKEYFDKNASVESVFTNCDSVADCIADIRNRFEQAFDEDVKNDSDFVELEYRFFMSKWTDINKLTKSGKYKKALEKILWCDDEISMLDFLKEFMIFDSTLEGKSQHELERSDRIKILYSWYFAPIYYDDVKKDGKTERHYYYYPTVDILFVEATALSRGGIVDDLNKKIDKYLEVCGLDLAPSQYEALRKGFEYLKAYEQEKLIINTMFTYKIARTPEQEARLAYLNKGVQNTPQIITDSGEDGEMLYDYRSMKWKDSDIRSYFDALTMNSQTITLPMVVDEWQQNLTGNNVKWDIKAVEKVIAESLNKNFGDRFVVSCVKSGAATETGTFTEPSIYIQERDREASAFPYLSFVVTGDQMMLSQINLAVYALFNPDTDEVTAANRAKKNAEFCSAMIMIKEKQNPKLNNFITTFKNVLIQELENWFNNKSETSIYD